MVRIGPKASTLAGHVAPTDWQGAQLQRLVRQAVRRVASDEASDRVLLDALTAAGMDQVPDALRQFAEFLFGPLREAVVIHVSLEASDVVVRSLSEVVSAKVDAARLRRAEEGRAQSDAPVDDGVPTVLVVENDPLLRAQLSRHLRENGYQAVSAHDGHLALAMCVRYRPQLVIASLDGDSSMAGRFAGLMKVAFGTEAPPLVRLVTEADDGKADDGAVAVLVKPVDESALMAVVLPILG